MRGDKTRARSCAEEISSAEGALVLAFHWEKGKVGSSAAAHLWADTHAKLEAAIGVLGGEPIVELDDYAQITRESGEGEAAC